MDNWPQFLNFLRAFLVPLASAILATAVCSCNDRNRVQMHLQRREALKVCQRNAMREGRSVRSVVETIEPETVSCRKFTCVNPMPKVGDDDVYRRLSANDEFSVKTEKAKPPTLGAIGYVADGDNHEPGPTVVSTQNSGSSQSGATSERFNDV